MLTILCSQLEKKKNLKQASWSIISRNNLKKPKNLQKLFGNSPIFENPIFSHDFFGPQEENIGIEPPNTFINLKQFGIQENDVVFVDNINHENFALAIKHLNNSDIVILKFIKKKFIS